MNGGSSALDKRLQTAYRAEVAESPALRREVRKRRKRSNSTGAQITRRLLPPIIWILIPASILVKESDARVALAIISLWTAGAAFRAGQQWFQRFYASEELVFYHLLPLNDEQIFSLQKRRYLFSFGWFLWELLIAYLALGMFDSAARPAWYALPIAALLQTCLTMAMGVHLASLLPMLPLGMISGLLKLAAIILFFTAMNKTVLVDSFVRFSEWFFPTGWLNYALVQVTQHGDLVSAVMLVPLLALIVAVRYSWQRLRGFYSLEGFEIVPTSNGGTLAPEEEELTSSSFGRRGPTEIEDNILGGSFIKGVNWDESGWFEKLASRFLTARERVLTEFLVAQKPGWTKRLRMTLVVWAICCVVVLLFGGYGGTLIFFTGYVLITASLPLFGGDWRGLRQTPSGNVFLPGFSVFPISFNEIARILVKINLLRILAVAPLLVSFAATAAFELGFTVLSGITIGAEIILLILCLQPVLILMPISKSTNDTSRMKAIWVFVFLPLLMAVIGLSAAIFFSKSFFHQFVLFGLVLALSWFTFLLYRWSYRKGKFDLLSERSSDSN